MTRPVTLRLDEPDYDRLHSEARHLGMKPGTLARVLLHASLSRGGQGGAMRANRRGVEALDRLAELTAGLPRVDAAKVAADARRELDRRSHMARG
jgi:hypothetical protein